MRRCNTGYFCPSATCCGFPLNVPAVNRGVRRGVSRQRDRDAVRSFGQRGRSGSFGRRLWLSRIVVSRCWTWCGLLEGIWTECSGHVDWMRAAQVVNRSLSPAAAIRSPRSNAYGSVCRHHRQVRSSRHCSMPIAYEPPFTTQRKLDRGIRSNSFGQLQSIAGPAWYPKIDRCCWRRLRVNRISISVTEDHVSVTQLPPPTIYSVSICSWHVQTGRLPPIDDRLP